MFSLCNWLLVFWMWKKKKDCEKRASYWMSTHYTHAISITTEIFIHFAFCIGAWCAQCIAFMICYYYYYYFRKMKLKRTNLINLSFNWVQWILDISNSQWKTFDHMPDAMEVPRKASSSAAEYMWKPTKESTFNSHLFHQINCRCLKQTMSHAFEYPSSPIHCALCSVCSLCAIRKETKKKSSSDANHKKDTKSKYISMVDR